MKKFIRKQLLKVLESLLKKYNLDDKEILERFEKIKKEN